MQPGSELGCLGWQLPLPLVWLGLSSTRDGCRALDWSGCEEEQLNDLRLTPKEDATRCGNQVFEKQGVADANRVAAQLLRDDTQ